MNREEVRELYKQSGITYKEIGPKEIANLINHIKAELDKSDNKLQMKVRNLWGRDVAYNEDGSVKYCYIKVDGYYFKRREAISFNSQGTDGSEFIGFAGWASSDNVQPFVDAFEAWLGELITSRS